MFDDDTFGQFGANEFLFNNSINKETKPRIYNKQSPSKIQGLANIPAYQQCSCSSINPCLMFRPMSRKSAADDYKLILTTDCLVTPDYPVYR